MLEDGSQKLKKHRTPGLLLQTSDKKCKVKSVKKSTEYKVETTE